MLKLVITCLILSLSGMLYAGDNTGSIRVIVTGFNHSSGIAGISLFSSEKGFPVQSKSAIDKVFAEIVQSTCTVVFKGVPYGQYAVSVFHDANMNKKLDVNIIGMPKEGIGSSNDAKGRFGPPKFKDASIVLDSSEISLIIKMAYIKQQEGKIKE